MAELFGLDIAQLVADSMESAGNLQPGTLIKSKPGQEDPNDPTAPVPSIATTHSFQGFIEEKAVRRDETLIAETIAVLTILGASVSPAAKPEVNDEATLGSITYQLVRLITRDPARAVYEFEVR